MIFKDLILKCDTNRVVDSIIAAYPDQVNLRDEYVKLIEKLRNMEPANPPSELILYVSKVIDYFDPNETYHDVSGYSIKDDCNYGIEFTPFAAWLSMQVAQPSLDHYGLDMFVAHCLWEMSFISFEEDEVQDELDRLNESVKAVKNGTAQTVEFDPAELCEDDGESEDSVRIIKSLRDDPDMPRERDIDAISAENKRTQDLMLGLSREG